jgi:hypothetical protein
VARIPCPYLQSDMELSAEREGHISERHPDLLPAYRDQLRQTLRDPDEVRSRARVANARVFSPWFHSISGGKYVVVVVVSEHAGRHWVVTAYLTTRLAEGVVERTRD